MCKSRVIPENAASTAPKAPISCPSRQRLMNLLISRQETQATKQEWNKPC